jgi:hypothetical protein
MTVQSIERIITGIIALATPALQSLKGARHFARRSAGGRLFREIIRSFQLD